jgi:putative phosphoesterase
VSTKIGLLSDVHARPEPVEEALSIFKREQVSKIICAGDIAGYFEELEPTIELLITSECLTITGNHDQTYIETHPDETDTKEYRFLNALPETLAFEVDGKRIYAVHAHPPNSQHGGIKLLDVDGKLIPEYQEYWRQELENFDYDVLIVGHTHQVFAEKLGDVLVVNPGSSQFNHSCMILTLPDMTVETFALENMEILKSWNFSMLFGSKSAYPPKKK